MIAPWVLAKRRANVFIFLGSILGLGGIAVGTVIANRGAPARTDHVVALAWCDA
jgi:hypothetical protein